MTERIGKIQTIKGLIEKDELGITHMHEHIFINYLDYFEKPNEQELKMCCLGGGSGSGNSNSNKTIEDLSNEKISLINNHWVQYNYNKNLHNLQLNEMEIAIRELEMFKRNGGSTIVEVTTKGIGRDPLQCLKVSQELNINIVMGAGYYLDKSISQFVQSMTEKQMEDEIVKQCLIGIDDTSIKAGIIGEVGCSFPLTNNEKKSLIASAKAQQRTGLSISIHPGRSQTAPLEIIQILKDSGADLSRVIIGHIDRTIHDINILLETAKTGCILEFDLFGMEISHYPFGGEVGMPSDNQRIEWIYQLIKHGYGENIVISHDIYTKHRLVSYGGHGYSHILFNIIPRMKKFGYSDTDINNILINNPKRLLTIIK
ncbi:phosphotriesterase-related protein [Dictyostelium discoideum AX4]|uniref:N-acetyltaurine hydrolase n=1 Tax=Dictyostelium discoideum TaxID=44689 RepID=PTER_DICDI|nr:phosphotriesterase-related protein [Dictyostelium discoideum AX4]Q54BV6.1 RecName: Full=Phosphotriesterase-related protein; AltName: Full=Parathion hydrolase-related protein [Dictyostelium discoideum]EAL60746.1 phosphotriesterase-related protein [Dictyostelium discoideum AX4]|eukprot:XP_629160.1 phosphotriesterase-related protein [Dictyostelium discoideum AX4]